MAGPCFKREHRLSIVLIVLGTLFFLDNIGLLDMGRIWRFWPLGLVALGVARLMGALEMNWRVPFSGAAPTADTVHEFQLFSGSKRKMESLNFKGGEIRCVFAGCKLDLRRCRIAPGEQAEISVSALFAGVEIKVPEGWQIITQCPAVFGACEDKSLAPRAREWRVAATVDDYGPGVVRRNRGRELSRASSLQFAYRTAVLPGGLDSAGGVCWRWLPDWDGRRRFR